MCAHGGQVMENDEGGVAGTLLAAVDHTVTGPGRRLLRRWLARPLGRPSAIRRRQDAVAALLGDCADAARTARNKLRCERPVPCLPLVASGRTSSAIPSDTLFPPAPHFVCLHRQSECDHSTRLCP